MLKLFFREVEEQGGYTVKAGPEKNIWVGRAGLALIALLLGWNAAALGSESGPAPAMAVSDAQLFTREFREGGALKFYDATEADLRLGKFELAMLRYRFLKGQVAGHPAYRPLMAMVDHRLKFLKEQMGLAGVEVAPLRPVRGRRAARKVATSEAGAADPLPAAKGAPVVAPVGKASEPSGAPPGKEPPGVPGAAPTPAPAEGKLEAQPPENGQGAPPGVLPASPAEDKVKESPPEPPPSPPPPSRWQRLKKRLLFWQ